MAHNLHNGSGDGEHSDARRATARGACHARQVQKAARERGHKARGGAGVRKHGERVAHRTEGERCAGGRRERRELLCPEEWECEHERGLPRSQRVLVTP